MSPEKYVGRIVRLNQRAFQEIVKTARRRGNDLENLFLVSAVNREMRKLICYGANLRISVCAADVVLI